MDRRFLVYVVDDEPLMLDAVQLVLEDECDVECFGTARTCLARLPERKPDLFLLDVLLPGTDGLELCRRLKEDAENADVPVTFVSGYDTIETRLACYEAGGEDFIVKPFNPDELRSKIAVARRILEEKKRLRETAGFAQRTAFTALSSMGELGIVIEFLRRSFGCTGRTELARAMIDALGQYGLDGAAQIRLGGDALTLSNDGVDLPLETAVLNHVRHQGRIFEFGKRGVYNFGGVTLLVKTMPLEDAERCGRLRDNLALLAEAADARRQAIEVEQANRRTRDGIGETLAGLYATLETLRRGHQQEQSRYTLLMVDVQEAMSRAFVGLGLTDAQEMQLIELIQTQMERLRDRQEFDHQVAAQIEALGAALRALAAR